MARLGAQGAANAKTLAEGHGAPNRQPACPRPERPLICISIVIPYMLLLFVVVVYVSVGRPAAPEMFKRLGGFTSARSGTSRLARGRVGGRGGKFDGVHAHYSWGDNLAIGIQQAYGTLHEL